MSRNIFSRVTSDLTGMSDKCKVIPPSDFSNSQAQAYVFTEMNEKLYFLLKSAKDEYAFTNIGMIHIDGERAISSKRQIHRYNYFEHTPTDVILETAGTADLDVEIKFTMGRSFSIDVVKAHLEPLIVLYKILTLIGMTKTEYARHWALVERSFEHSRDAVGRLSGTGSASSEYRAILQHAQSELLAAYDKYHPQEYNAAFELYLVGE
ncbi:PH domain-containing protein [Saccharibacillus kuerlensis]|uniref:Bacterial Pleckstrin homology domain-containing protein n=1 Tax=Saccharibacillus kuerlensis TaxID=459527 RepID=A0ABQ2LC70_9BACL|nr:PH domain-containing protein [Saccharibacillus kuerlensis]GGO09843.1 hypothetical protein GCM10010969_40650 [Saccharibacillus kuerlensis]